MRHLLLYGASVVSDSMRPHRWQPTRLPRPWDSPGENTGVGCHFLLQHMKVAQSCPTLSDPTDCSPPGSSVHGIFQARVLETRHTKNLFSLRTRPSTRRSVLYKKLDMSSNWFLFRITCNFLTNSLLRFWSYQNNVRKVHITVIFLAC